MGQPLTTWCHLPCNQFNHMHYTSRSPKTLQEMQQEKNLKQKKQSLLTSSSGPVIGSASLAKSGKFYILSALSALSSTKSYHNSRILYSGVTDHMTPTTNEFIRYEPCPVGKRVQTANGSLQTVAGIGM